MKILIVDDSTTSRMLFRIHMPKEVAAEIVEASNMAEAMVKAQAHHPDLVVLDYNMPDHNGVEIATAMREQGLTAVFVLLTANTQKSVLDAASQAGFVQVLEKPVSSDKIASMLKQVA